MDKYFNRKFNKVEYQLNLLDKKKKEILKDLYITYDTYLTNIRYQLFSSVTEGVITLAGMIQNKGKAYDEEVYMLIGKDIKLLIDQFLPFLTIEQLSLIDQYYPNENNFIKFECNQLIEEKDINAKNSPDLQTSYHDCIYYYSSFKRNNLENSINLDNKHYHSNFTKLEPTLLDSKEEEIFLYSQKLNENLIINKNKRNDFNTNIFEENQLSTILEWSNLIDIGLSTILKKISLEVNKIFFENIFVKENISEHLISYFFDNDFMTTNPKPFIAKLDLLSNELIYSDEILKNINFTKIYLLCINSTELEFNNITLNIQRSKITELKEFLKILIKKEKYWSSKKLYSNYDLNKVYKN